ncbi:MAG TPA: DUF2971 domain-containing protein [Flavobacterium sp.]|nr:DUF2971 domain-containing protein [Flavobacterium sp.]
MKFFIPTIDSDKAEDFLENSIIRFIESQGFKVLRNKKIYSINFQHNGKTLIDIVGQVSESNNEPVFAILETEDLYLVCTTRRGVVGGEPMLTGKKGVTVKYFDDEETNTYKYGEWIYKLVNQNHAVEHPKKQPKSVFKYYSISENSISAILNQYLYCSHPYNLNDSMDCSTLLWDFSTLSKPLFLKFYEQYGLTEEFEIDYEKDKKNGFAQIKELFFNFITNHAGIISLSTQPLHTLMWAHYSSEKGFMIELDWEIIKNNLKKENPKLNNYIFFPVQYVENLESIDFFGVNFRSADVPFLYSVGVKRNDWAYEGEWRLITYSTGYGTPTSIISPFPNVPSQQERRVQYPIEAIKSITLGKQFFNGRNVEKLLEPMTFQMKDVQELKLIEFMIENLPEKIFLCGEYETEKSFKRSSERVNIIKKDKNIFTVVRMNEGFHQ